MPLPLLGAAAISAGGALLGNLLNRNSQERANKQNWEMAKYQNQWNLDMWNRQNEYNSPLAQMQRLKDAGLNPNMVYGNGSAANQADAIKGAEVPHMQAYTGFGDLGASAIVNSMLTSSQIKNMEEQNEILKTDAMAKKLEVLRTGLKLSGEVQDFHWDRNLKRYASRLSDLAIVQAEQDYDKGWIEYDIKQAELNMAKVREKMTQTEYETLQAKLRSEVASANIREHESRDYEQLGIRPSDPLWSRAIANVLLQMFGKDKAQSLIKSILGI